MSTLGERIRIARDHAELSQEALGKALGISQSAVSQIESSDADKSKFTFEIAEVTGVRSLWLAKEIGPMVEDFTGELVAEIMKDPPEAQKELQAVARALRETRRKT